MIRTSQQRPMVLKHAIQTEKQSANLTHNYKDLVIAQVGVADNMNSLPSKVLQAPTIVYQNSHKIINFAEWDIGFDLFVDPSSFKNIAVFYHGMSIQDAGYVFLLFFVIIYLFSELIMIYFLDVLLNMV